MRRRRAARIKEQTFTPNGAYITLGQLLQAAGIVSSGGEAKLFLSEVPILVNGEEENRRGRKLRTGDLIQIPDSAQIRIGAGTENEGDETQESEEIL